MSTISNRSDFISNVRAAATELLDARDKLQALRWQWDKEMGIALEDATGSDPEAEGYDAGDFSGSNAGLRKADVTAVFTSADALDVLLDAGHGTNFQKVRT